MRAESERLAAHRAADARWRQKDPERARQLALERGRRWPWKKAVAAVQTARRQAKRYGVPIGSITKGIVARLHLLPCVYCGLMPAMGVDHIRPFRVGGDNELTNLAPSCDLCNKQRGGWLMAALGGYRPPAPEWRDENGRFPARTHCKAGHPITGPGLCLPCVRLWKDRYNAQRRRNQP